MNMVGDTNQQSHDSTSDGTRRVARKRVLDKGGKPGPTAIVTGSPRETVARAMSTGLLDSAQARALEDLLSRTNLLGFESRKVISVLVNNIALEKTEQRRRELVLQLREYLEGDGLAKDLTLSLSAAFAIR
jgi:hypothetical protein